LRQSAQLQHNLKEIGLVFFTEAASCNDECIGHFQGSPEHFCVLALQEIASNDQFQEGLDVLLKGVEVYGSLLQNARKSSQRRAHEEGN